MLRRSFPSMWMTYLFAILLTNWQPRVLSKIKFLENWEHKFSPNKAILFIKMAHCLVFFLTPGE